VELDLAPFGVIGLETSFGISYQAMVLEEKMKFGDLVERMAVAPRRILRLPGGRLELGRPADLTIIAPAWEWSVDPSRFASLSRNCPFTGRTLKGKILLTVAEGKVTHAAVGPPAAGSGRTPGGK
jgi:dihydroorotase